MKKTRTAPSCPQRLDKAISPSSLRPISVKPGSSLGKAKNVAATKWRRHPIAKWLKKGQEQGFDQ